MHAIHFDLDGTLVKFDRPYAELLAKTCERVLDTRDESVVGAYSSAFFERLRPVEPDPYDAGARAAIHQAGVDASSKRFVETLREVEYGATAVREGVPALLDSLDDRPLGVVSNGVGDWQRRKLDAVGLTGRFDSVVTSYDAGVAKPDPGIFAFAAERLPAAEHMMVGDNADADIAGADAAGWRTVHLDGGAGVRAGTPADLVGLA